jgi:Fe2+ transport system protein B
LLNPDRFGELATAVQENVVMATSDVRFIEVAELEQIAAVVTAFVTCGVGLTVTTKFVGTPVQVPEAGVMAYVTVPGVVIRFVRV